MARDNIFLTGFSGSGKSQVGRMVAQLLGWRFVDTDAEIEEAEGRPIPQIFAQEGEAYFRRLERETLARVCRGRRQVVATGGGMVVDEGNRRLMAQSGVVVCLEATPETLHRRLQAQARSSPAGAVRPLLEGRDPLARIRSLKSQRQPFYTLADWTVHTDHLSPQQVAQEVIRGWRLLRESREMSPAFDSPDLASVVRTSSGDYPVWVGWGLLEELGRRAREVVGPQVAYVIGDEHVYPHARKAQLSLEAAGITAHLFLFPPGEASKTLDTAQHIYRWLAERRAERGHLVVAVGGGVVGDLAGFVAATFLRGMPLVQVPTSLLAMMDAAIGGKVAVDLPQGKNLVGAFYQPRFVLADVATLATLDRRELTSGWAEAIKHGLIMDADLLDDFEARREAILALDPQVAAEVIRRSVAIKARVVSQDERETLGIRILLNYGHTIGHAIEAATGYGRYLHGEAVSIGMMGAGYISAALGMLSQEGLERQRALLEAYGLPIECPDMDVEAVGRAMLVDKKTSGRAIRWVLLERIGKAVTRSDVPQDLVREALEWLAR